ncbi:MAG TPA: tRNA (guanosine(37)-N1)-methyltransferase TrmD [Candidatus Paceibacterota bacterium]
MLFDIITIFPKLFDGFLSESLISRAQTKKILKIGVHNLRKWTTDKHKTVDGKPFGGGVGMVMKVEPIYKAVKNLKPNKKTRVILFSPRGKKLTQADAKRLIKYNQLILICGRYEGVDERVADHIADEIISIGDYILNGGEVAAMALIEVTSRMIPGFIAKQESANKFDHAQYTRPEEFFIKEGIIFGEKTKNKKQIWKVPKVLLSGNHKKIEEWRKKHAKKKQFKNTIDIVF